MNELDIPISTRSIKYYGNHVIYELETTHGMLDAVFNPITGRFGIMNIDVEPDYRRQGIGKALLRAALRVAEEQDARFVYAAIISRECLEAMRGVFGEATLQVSEEGGYSVPGETKVAATQASLWFQIEHT